MNILFLFVSLQHLDNDSAIFTSLIHEFKEKGHNVKVVTKDKIGEPTRLVKIGKKKMSAACRQRAIDEYDKDNCFEEYVRLYDSLLTQ